MPFVTGMVRADERLADHVRNSRDDRCRFVTFIDTKTIKVQDHQSAKGQY